MKKLMIVAAAALCATVFADIESSNTVGYQEMDLAAGKQVMKGAMFVTVGGSTLNLQNISMDAETPADATTMLWWWDKDAKTYTTAYWVDLYDAGGNDLGMKGWGDGESWVALEKAFKSGEGFWVKPPAAASVKIAGEVVTTSRDIASLAYDMTAGKQEQLTNPFPVGSFSLQSVKLDASTPADATAMAWWWDKDAKTYTTAYWVDLYDAGGNDLGMKGWGDGESWVEIEKTFEVGEAFWVKAPADAQVIWANPSYVPAN